MGRRYLLCYHRSKLLSHEKNIHHPVSSDGHLRKDTGSSAGVFKASSYFYLWNPYYKSSCSRCSAPVTKTVTYGTVTNIPGETTKCWITSNLGADQQANAVGEATEPYAGWYWQFNRKQGYKHDGTTRTPNTTWINSIVENSDWITANDPCNIELGTTWRIPTYTEWYNVDNTGSWINLNGPWGSGLKLHAAGYLRNSDGSLTNRGSYGEYWSSTQYDAAFGSYLGFDSSDSYMYNSSRAFGFSARCVRDY